MTRHKTFGVWFTAALLALAFALTGCREDEQNRVITLEKGQYPGDKPSGLTQGQLDELRQRAQEQNAN
jgi:hypothetical protein